jgi:hypothetical protein
MKNVLIYSFGMIIFFSSCFKKDDKDLVLENYNADWALQVINSEFNIADLLDGSDTNNLSIEIVDDDIILSYSTEQQSDLSEEFYSIPDQSFSESYTSEQSLPFTIAGLAFDLPTLDSSWVLPNVPLDVDGIEIEGAALKEILVETGVIELSVTNTFQHSVNLDLVIPSISKNGQELSFSNMSIPANSSVPITEIRSIAGYTVNLKKDGVLNTLQIKMSAGVTFNGGPITTSDQIGFSLAMKDVSYEHVIGRLGRFTIPFDQGSTAISLFDDLDFDGELHIETFNLKTTTVSDWGIPLSLNIEQLEFTSALGNTVIDCIDNSIDMKALGNVSLVGIDSVVSPFDLGTTNCPSLANVIKTRPNGFNYDLSFTVNSEDVDSDDFFISKNSSVKTSLEGQFYLHGYLKDFSRSDTISDIDLSSGDDETGGVIEEATIRFIFENGMPLELGVDLYFLDENEVVIDQEIDKILISSSAVDGEGYSTTSTSNTIDVVLSANRMLEISDKVDKIVMISRLNTSGAQQFKNVHIRPQDKMKIIIGVRATVDIDLN